MDNVFLNHMEEILNKKWKFYGDENSSEEIDDEVITDLDDNWIGIISDFYSVEGINRLSKNADNFPQDKISLRKLTKQHSDILRMKLFCKIELRKCLKVIKENKLSFDDSYLDLPSITNVESLWRFLISKSDDNEYSLEKLIVFQKLFLLLDYSSLQDDYMWFLQDDYMWFLRDGYMWFLRDGYWWYFIKEYKKEKKKFLSELANNINEMFEKIDTILKDCETQIFTFISSKSLDIFSSAFSIKEFARIFCDEVKKQEIEKYALEDRSCYASMKIGEDIYITVNGIEGKPVKGSNLQTLQCIFSQLVPYSKYVSITDETRYFTGKNNIITYKQFSDAKPEKSKNRMFTCCERKLIAKYLEIDGGKVELTVTRSPCIFCQRELNSVNLCKESIEVRSVDSSESNIDEKLIKDFDDYAEEILKKNIGKER